MSEGLIPNSFTLQTWQRRDRTNTHTDTHRSQEEEVKVEEGETSKVSNDVCSSKGDSGVTDRS